MLTSVHNDLVKHVTSLKRRKDREDAQEFVIEGLRFVREAFLRKADILQLIYTSGKTADFDELLNLAQGLGIPSQEVSDQVFAKMSSTESPQGILAVIKQVEYKWEDLSFASGAFLIIDGIQDPGNLGTILRTALASGIKEVCLTQGTVDFYNPKVLRSTMGTIFSLKVIRNQTPERVLKECEKHSLNLVVADMNGKSMYSTNFKGVQPFALVVGNEGNGPSQKLKEKTKLKVAIPMENEVESLNVGVAAAVLLYEIHRQLSQ